MKLDVLKKLIVLFCFVSFFSLNAIRSEKTRVLNNNYMKLLEYLDIELGEDFNVKLETLFVTFIQIKIDEERLYLDVLDDESIKRLGDTFISWYPAQQKRECICCSIF